MNKLIKIIKLIAVITLIVLALNIVSKQDIEFEHQRAQLVGYSK